MVSRFFCRTALVFALGAMPALAGPPSIKTFPAGQTVRADALGSAVCDGWVEIRTREAAAIQLWDITLEAGDHSRLLVGASSAYIYALTLSGEFRAGKLRAPAGKVLVWSHYGNSRGAPVSYSFSAERLAEVFAGKGHAGDADLAAIAAAQKKKRFWGLLRPTGFNVATPVSPELEELRESYQTKPVMIAIKRASRDKAEYARNTAERFVRALGQGDARTVAALISPSLFLEGASASQTERLLEQERAAFARQLTGSGEYGRFRAADVSDLGDGVFVARAGERGLLITLEPFDDGLYVASLKPE